MGSWLRILWTTLKSFLKLAVGKAVVRWYNLRACGVWVSDEYAKLGLWAGFLNWNYQESIG